MEILAKRIGRAFKGARDYQKKMGEHGPQTIEYEQCMEIFTAVQASARREFSYKGCIHGQKERCIDKAREPVILCDHCINYLNEREKENG